LKTLENFRELYNTLQNSTKLNKTFTILLQHFNKTQYNFTKPNRTSHIFTNSTKPYETLQNCTQFFTYFTTALYNFVNLHRTLQYYTKLYKTFFSQILTKLYKHTKLVLAQGCLQGAGGAPLACLRRFGSTVGGFARVVAAQPILCVAMAWSDEMHYMDLLCDDSGVVTRSSK